MSPLFLDVDDAGLTHPSWCDHGTDCYVTDAGTPDVSAVHTRHLPMLTLREWRWADGRVKRVVTADWEEITDDVDGQAVADLEVLARDAWTAREWLAAGPTDGRSLDVGGALARGAGGKVLAGAGKNPCGATSCAHTEHSTHATGAVSDIGTVHNVGTVGAVGVVGRV